MNSFFKTYPWTSNFHKCKISFNDRVYDSVDEIYQEYTKYPEKFKNVNGLNKYNNLNQVMYIATGLKFLQNPSLRKKLLGITEEFPKTTLGGRLKDIQSVLKGLER